MSTCRTSMSSTRTDTAQRKSPGLDCTPRLSPSACRTSSAGSSPSFRTSLISPLGRALSSLRVSPVSSSSSSARSRRTSRESRIQLYSIRDRADGRIAARLADGRGICTAPCQRRLLVRWLRVRHMVLLLPCTFKNRRRRGFAYQTRHVVFIAKQSSKCGVRRKPSLLVQVQSLFDPMQCDFPRFWVRAERHPEPSGIFVMIR